MKSDIGNRKLATSRAQLAVANKEIAAQHATATAKDVHAIDRGDSFKPIKVVGGDENKNSHNTEYQKKMQRNETETLGTKNLKHNSIFSKQVKSNPALFD